jgi:hypothetical protein
LGSDAADQDTKKFASQLSAGAKIAIRAVAAVSTFLRLVSDLPEDLGDVRPVTQQLLRESNSRFLASNNGLAK